MTTTEGNCKVCGGTGWKIVERGGLSGAERCVCAAAMRARDLKDGSRIPPNYEQASLDNFQMPADNPIARQGLGTVLMQVRSFTREFPAATRPGLLLIGEPGTGKTHLAVAAMRALLDKGHECLFFDYQNLLDRIRSGYDAASGAADREAYRAALDAEVLLLDDLGAHRVTDWVEDTVTAIITHRCNQKKPLIATTNLTDDDRVRDFAMPGGEKKAIRERTLAEMIGTRARSRLHEMCRVVRMPAVEDYRVTRVR
jgi:DNA replication protein DnaC